MSENQPAIENVTKMRILQNIASEPTEYLMAIFADARRSMRLGESRESAIVIEGTIRRELERRCSERGGYIATSPILPNGTCIAAKIVDDVIFDRFIAEPNLAKKLVEDAK